ncbi:MAG: hypothetical protein V3U67_04495 [Gemmatimonadota bacterium]
MESKRQSWLFVRGDESVRMMSFLSGLTLLVCGPGTAEHSQHFDSEASLDKYRRWYEQSLIDDKWVLAEDVDRRRSGQQRPPARERRRRIGDDPSRQ